MKKCIFVWLLILLSASFLPRPTIAEEQKLSLREAILTSFANNHELKARQSSLAATQADIGIARSYLLPSLLFEEKVTVPVPDTFVQR